MEKPDINFLREKYALNASRPKAFLYFRRLAIIALAVVAAMGAIFSYGVSSGSDRVPDDHFSLFATIRGFVSSDDRLLLGEKDDRINVLLLGVGGSGHDGPQLADTMIFASYKPSTGQVGMLSLPRDLIVPIPGYGWRKINHANAFGEVDHPGEGAQLAKKVVEDILDQPIHYFVRVDFNGFAKVIDDMDGVDVDVERAFKDEQYPVSGMETAECDIPTIAPAGVDPAYGCRFETVSFEKGMRHMDGQTALAFVRSRHGTNGEGSDFARSRRQQKVLIAVKDELLSASTILSPSRLNRILETIGDHLATNLATWEWLRLGKKLSGIDTASVRMHTLDVSADSPLYATSYNGAYVLMPKNDDWQPIQSMASDIFSEEPSLTLSAVDSNIPRVEIQNGTSVTGLALDVSERLKEAGFKIVKIGNAIERTYEQTVLYDVTQEEAVEWPEIGSLLELTLSPLNEDAYRNLTNRTDIDFLLILGENAASLLNEP